MDKMATFSRLHPGHASRVTAVLRVCDPFSLPAVFQSFAIGTRDPTGVLNRRSFLVDDEKTFYPRLCHIIKSKIAPATTV